MRSVVAESEEDVEVVRDILWSDPWDQSDVVDNFKRNAGCLIPDGALGEWLQREKFVRLVRSHETEATGAAVTPVPPGERWTVFSCSRHPNRVGLNKAAVPAGRRAGRRPGSVRAARSVELASRMGGRAKMIGPNKAAVLQPSTRARVNVRRWDAGEDDRARRARAPRPRRALPGLRGRARGLLFHLRRGQGHQRGRRPGRERGVWDDAPIAVPRRRLSSAAEAKWHEIRDFLSVDLPARHLPPRAATSPAAHAVFDLLDTDRDGVVRRAEFLMPSAR